MKHQFIIHLVIYLSVQVFIQSLLSAVHHVCVTCLSSLNAFVVTKTNKVTFTNSELGIKKKRLSFRHSDFQ